VTIVSPEEGERVRCTVPISVHAVDPVFPFGHDRSGIRSVQFWIDPADDWTYAMYAANLGTLNRREPYPAAEDRLYEWNTAAETLGEHVILVRATDGAYNRTEVTRTVSLEICAVHEGEIDVRRENLRLHDHHYSYDLVVENTGPATAYRVSVREEHEGFQIVAEDSAGAWLEMSISPPGPADDDCRVNTVGLSIGELGPGERRSFHFQAVPILLQDASLDYIIGRATEVEYRAHPTAWITAREDQSAPLYLTSTWPTTWSAGEVIGSSRYLIVTHVPNLFAQEAPQIARPNEVLTKMAELAILRDGVLGYLRTSDRAADLRGLIEPGGEWASQLHSLFGSELQGYLLLVGESEIVPAVSVSTPGIEWSGGKRSVAAPYSDLAYGDIIGGDGVPDLIVGRLIGDTDGTCGDDLVNALETSIAVAREGTWDRSRGLVTSGSEGDWEEFVTSAIDTWSVLNDQMMPRGGFASTQHWSRWVHNTEVDAITGYDLPLTGNDGFLLADTDGDGVCEAVVVDDTIDIATVYERSDFDWSLTLPWTSFFCLFTPHDGLAAGDIDGDGVDEIIVAIDESNTINIFNDDRHTAGRSWPEFSVTFDPWDVVAAGDLWGDEKDEIILATREDYGTVYVYSYETGGTYPELRLRDTMDYVSFTAWDGFGVGNVSGGLASKDEIVVANDSTNRIYVHNNVGANIGELECDPFTPYDALAVGDMDGDGMDEIAVIIDDIVDGKKRLFLFQDNGWYWDAAESQWKFHRGGRSSIYSRYLEFDGVRTTSSSTRHDGFDVGDLDGDGVAEVVVALENGDRLYIYDGNYADGWRDRFMPEVRLSAPDLEIFAMRGHGSSASCSPFRVRDIDTLDLDAHPLVLGLTCLSGNYEGEWAYVIDDVLDPHSDGDHGLAEAFFERGAAAYIGATHVSSSSYNNPSGPAFFESWDADETAGHAFTQYERLKALSGDRRWKYWVAEYNYYGDPKFGVVGGASDVAEQAEESRAAPPPSTVQVSIPMYEVTTLGDEDYVRIPGGDILLEEGKPEVPFYVKEVDCPAGYQVQDVALEHRSEALTAEGWNLPIAVFMTDTMPSGFAAPASAAEAVRSAGEEWYPAKDYEWRLVNHADGSSALVLVIYPFYYNSLTTGARFHQDYSFRVTYATSATTITKVATDKRVYQQGDAVTVAIALENAGQPQDVIVEASIRRYGSDETVDGLLLQTLGDLTGPASFSPQWDSAGFEPGDYTVDVEVKDTIGNLLARKSKLFTLGVSAGEITSFQASPRRFDVGEQVSISLVLRNAGTTELSGSAVIRVKDHAGGVIAEFRQSVAGLAPGRTVAVDEVWDTSGAQEGLYTLLGYVLYESSSASPATIVVTTQAPVYLPIVLTS
jgi:hypothetical protein